MGAVKLELRCHQRIDGIAVDPDPDWKFDTLLSELNSLETKLNTSTKVPAPFIKARPRDFSNEKSANTSRRPFVMHVSDDEMEDTESEVEEDRSLVAAKRFNCDKLYLSNSDDSDDESDLEFQSYLMGEVGSVEGVLCELTDEHELDVKEEIRNRISALESDLMGQSEKSSSALTRVERYREARWEMDRKLDTHYQRKIAEALDNHLTAVQRDHELRSQIEERKIRSDAAYEEAKRKEKALQEEKVRQEKAKVESEARLRAEEAKSAALEAERREAKEAAEREATETSTRAASGVAQEEAARSQIDANSRTSNESKGFASDAAKKSQSASNVLRAAESALNLEQGRLQKFKEIDERNQALRLTYNKDFSSFERHIARLIRQISGTKEIVSEKSHDIFKIFNDPLCPQSISIAAFAKKVVSRCESPEYDVFACGHVIVLVTSQVPLAMDLLLAELHRACIYTVPKHIIYSKSAFKSKEAYYKAIGYKERDGKIESVEDYLKRLDSYMRLYGALIQTEVEGVQNLHGLKEGWAWIARFLNTLPANRYTAVALYAFLQMAGFALFRKYKSQFMKMLSIISNNFLEVLKAREESGLRAIIVEIQSYMEDKRFLKEPEGRALRGSLLSSVLVPEQNYQQSYHHQPPNRYSYY
ncbi:mRNA export factor GLE1 isoform X2 [Corylus avellana]|uniref:mRNA export factor GLE1 isoform X2 n=1 Tax=Corylus avellana TaxID=13451 RepID=UPI00286A0E71|nr:mRNA export factor GLE1 isoform X2 [Corylus avellana]